MTNRYLEVELDIEKLKRQAKCLCGLLNKLSFELEIGIQRIVSAGKEKE